MNWGKMSLGHVWQSLAAKLKKGHRNFRIKLRFRKRKGLGRRTGEKVRRIFRKQSGDGKSRVKLVK